MNVAFDMAPNRSGCDVYGLAEAIAALGPRLKPAQAGAALEFIVNAVRATTGNYQLHTLAQAVAALGPRLNPVIRPNRRRLVTCGAPRIAAATPRTGPSPMADDHSRADPDALVPALPVPTTSLATLDAATLAPGEIAAALRFAEAAKAANTRRAYAADWADFCRWAATRGAGPLPCPPGLLCGYLAALADSGLRASTITRRAAAIAHHHRAAGLDPPTANPSVRVFIAAASQARVLKFSSNFIARLVD
jgi:Phage integrase, N-terminal SAM-like domain